ncbi:MAG: TraB/GumN family protein [Pseudomonadota bacterium]|nr:TraB/GumN family protein [Pseudomonadota bacterium]
MISLGRLTVAVFALAFLPPAVFARDDPPRADLIQFSKGLLWKVEKKGVVPSYLFGTIHVDDDRVLALPPAVKKAFDRSRVFAAELVNDEAATRKFFAAMVTREPHLPALLGGGLYSDVDKLLAQYNIPSEARPRFKPWAAMLTLLQPRGATGMILDRKLLFDADEARKKIVGLESIEEQIAVFDQMPQQTQIILLREVVANHETIQGSVLSAVEAYLERDLSKLWKLNAEAMSDDAGSQSHNEVFLNRLLYQRNERMVERLLPLFDRGGAFAAFGALHLYGKRGVPSLIEQRGYKVQRVY